MVRPDQMGNNNAIPVVSRIKSAVQAMSGDFDGASDTEEQLSKQCPVISQLRSALEATYDLDAANRTQHKFLGNVESVPDATPIVGHVKGAVHSALSQTEPGEEYLRSASHTTASVISTGVLSAGAVSAATLATGGNCRV